jgi:hypothetical protein
VFCEVSIPKNNPFVLSSSPEHSEGERIEAPPLIGSSLSADVRYVHPIALAVVYCPARGREWGRRMVEVMIEQWRNLDGSVDFLWSVWRDGERVQMGGPHANPSDAKSAAKGFCTSRLGLEPDAVTEL